MSERCVIVGAGQAGGRIALLLREYGFAGDICLVGAEDAPPYERPPLSKAHLAEAPAEPAFLASRHDYLERRIDLRLGMRVEGVDLSAGQVWLGHERTAFDRLVFATGARARRLDHLPGAALAGIEVLRTLADARLIERGLRSSARVVVIGGGFIGLEVAAAARARRCEVVVVEAAAQLMGRSVSAPIAAAAGRAHRRAGVEINFRAAPTRFFGGAAIEAVTLETGRRYRADLVIVGVGAVARDALARNAGLACDDGVLVDALGRTSHPCVHAAGDVTRRTTETGARGARLESWHNAQRQAVAVARDIVGLPPAPDEADWVWSDQGADQIQIVGDVGDVGGVDVIARVDPGQDSLALFHMRGEVLAGVETFNRASEAALARRLVGKRVELDREALGRPDIPLRRALWARGAQAEIGVSS